MVANFISVQPYKDMNNSGFYHYPKNRNNQCGHGLQVI
ncbi:hypothetical protein MCC93_26420 [Morococcus cerebrosus]|uniref:Uncharacterized protein n=1 Tax=Morococcus cerebrosus TaxID=1056807 RepID=A0A0C1EAQ9_9NEIS|nr:hypothetical protein MCC93_26420 [Morococcus cerebrosus]